MDETLAVINTLEAEGVIGKYAIGGAVALLFYAEPTTTYYLDIFCYRPQTQSGLINIGPLYDYLSQRGYKSEGEHISIEGIPVQFLPPPTELVKESLENAADKQVNGVPTRVFDYEYLLAIMVETGRPKDRSRITDVLESAKPDPNKLDEILKRYGLLDRWSKIVT
ncbi:hypothetical protein BH10CYA1_BH10CYA1_00990 [soil metagenome]